MVIPVVCEEDGCSNYGCIVNHVTGVSFVLLDLFYENYDESEPADYCPVCGVWGVAEDPLLG